MSLFITEHQGWPMRQQVAINRPLAFYSLTSAAAAVPTSGCNYILVTADAGSYLGLYSSTTAALTSTNAFRVPANVAPQIYAVSTLFKIVAAGT